MAGSCVRPCDVTERIGFLESRKKKQNACWLWVPLGNVVTKDSERRQTLTNPPHRVAGTRRATCSFRSPNQVLIFFQFHYFLWPVLSIFTCKLVTFIGCSFLLTIKQRKIKKQPALPFLTLPDHETGLRGPKQEARLSLKLELKGTSQGTEITRNHCLEGPGCALRGQASALPCHWGE